jgi:hypothetical protein
MAVASGLRAFQQVGSTSGMVCMCVCFSVLPALEPRKIGQCIATGDAVWLVCSVITVHAQAQDCSNLADLCGCFQCYGGSASSV